MIAAQPLSPAREHDAVVRGVRGVVVAAALVALAVAGYFLVIWLIGTPPLIGLATTRMKTNTAVSLSSLAAALVLFGAGGRATRARGVAIGVLCGLATLIGSLVLIEYALDVNFGIDELLRHEAPSQESGRFPNRMAPNAALGIVLLSLSIAIAAWQDAARHVEQRRSRRRLAAAFVQAAAVLALLLGFAALLGYAYGVVFLFKPTAFIRVSPYSAFCFVMLSLGVLALAPQAGLARLLRRADQGGRLVRTVMFSAVVVVPVAGWVLAEMVATDVIDGATAAAVIVVILAVGTVAALVVVTDRIDASDARRRALELEHAQLARLTLELARAQTVEEVVDATLAFGVPALGGVAGGVFVVGNDGQLHMRGTRGYDATVAAPFATIPLDASTPVAEAVRTREPVIVIGRDAFLARYLGVRPEQVPGASAAWAALPLEGRQGPRGALGVTFADRTRLEGERRGDLVQCAAQCAQALDRALLFEQAQAASRAKDEFLAMLGHELRNPLSPILTSLELMARKHRDVAVRERGVIERQVKSMARLVDDLLDVSRVARGKISLDRTRVDVGAVVATALEVTRPALERAEHALHVDVEPGLDAYADPHRLQQVLVNLVTNAIRYTARGGSLSVKAARVAGEIVIDVGDNGAGIPAALLPRLFEPFTQGERGLERAGGGLGLGLALSRGIVEAHDGRIEIDTATDEANHGTRVRVALPTLDPVRAAAAAPAAAPVPAPALVPAPRGAGAGAPAAMAAAAAAGGGKRVLVVDDNRDAADSLAALLRDDGHEVFVAYDGDSALEAARTHAPIVAFVDIGLPGMDGYEVGRRLRDMLRPLRLVAVTGYGQPGDRSRTAAAGFDDHLVKPVGSAETLAHLR